MCRSAQWSLLLVRRIADPTRIDAHIIQGSYLVPQVSISSRLELLHFYKNVSILTRVSCISICAVQFFQCLAVDTRQLLGAGSQGACQVCQLLVRSGTSAGGNGDHDPLGSLARTRAVVRCSPGSSTRGMFGGWSDRLSRCFMPRLSRLQSIIVLL